MSSKTIPPAGYQAFRQRFPKVAERYEALGDAVHAEGPLTDRERALVKLAISGGASKGTAFVAHIRKAREAGVERAAMEQVALLLLPTMGRPVMMRALHAIDRAYQEES